MGRKRRLFVDGRWLAQPGQGVYTYSYEIYSRLVARNIPEIDLIFGLPPNVLPSFLPLEAKTLEYRSDSFLWRQLFLGQQINKLKPDFVHFQYVLPMGLNARIHKLVALHDVLFLEHPEFFSLSYRVPRKLFFGMSARQADSLLTISKKSSEDIQKHLGISPQRISVIPLGTGSRLRRVAPIEIAKLIGVSFILTVGRHEPRKNYARLIEAFVLSRLNETRGIFLVIVGWIAEEFRLPQMEIPEGVLLITDCSDAQLAWLYSCADGFVFPSVAEGYGLPLVEAIEFGVPSAASRTYPIDCVRASCVASFDPYSVEEICASLYALVDLDRSVGPVRAQIPTWDDYVDRFVEIILRKAPKEWQ